MKQSIELTNAQAWLLLDLVQEETTRINAKTDIQYRSQILASLQSLEKKIKTITAPSKQSS